jgi:hypothetical protein
MGILDGQDVGHLKFQKILAPILARVDSPGSSGPTPTLSRAVPSFVPTTNPYDVRSSAMKTRGSPTVIVPYRNWSTEIDAPVSR